jgi:hypothetical protein
MTTSTQTTTRLALGLSLSALISACSGGHDPLVTTIGATGGTLSTQSGITLRVPAGAVSSPTDIRLVETPPRQGAMARIELEPRGLVLAVPATLAFKVEDGNVRLAEIEHGPQGEARRALEKRRHTGEVEIELEHLAEVEMEHGLTCDVACDAGFECDDGVCQAHVEDDPASPEPGDDHGVDPSPAPGAPADDHGVDPAPAPAPPGTLPDDHGGHGPGHP